MKRLPSMSVIIAFVAAMIVGAAMIPLLNVQYTPTQREGRIDIYAGWRDASPDLVEREVTSKIEGIAASVKGISEISSYSSRGLGHVIVSVKDRSRLNMIRFELMSRIRDIYDKLPEGVSYPEVSGSASGEVSQPVVTYRIDSKLPTGDIEYYLQEHVVEELSLVEGVGSVSLSGVNPSHEEVLFDPAKLAAYDISIEEFVNAVRSAFDKSSDVGIFGNKGVVLNQKADISELDKVVIKKVGDRIIYVGDVADITYKEKAPEHYFRINGLDYVNVTVYAAQDVNTIAVCRRVRERMSEIEPYLPEYLSVELISDSSDSLKAELAKVIRRIVLCVVLLLLFAFAVNRNPRYLASIAISLAANMLIAVVFYVIFNIDIHIYSLAGITVSLGIIIDTTIVMISHYAYYHNRSVFRAILAAQLTSIGALCVIFLFPWMAKTDLNEFAAVIIINLAISLVIAVLLIPALSDVLSVSDGTESYSWRQKRRIAAVNGFYSRYIRWARRHRWAVIAVLILGFGIPISLLPPHLYPREADKAETAALKECYNRTLGSHFFVEKMKNPLSKVVGGSIGWFFGRSSRVENDPEARLTLTIRASLPDGCTTAQLNDVVLDMENYLSQFEEVDVFSTSITSPADGYIYVTFKKEFEHSAFPMWLRDAVVSKAIDFGGANWSVWGISTDNFSNNVSAQYKPHHIFISGYNYDALIGYCQECVDYLKSIPRVQDPEIAAGNGRLLSATEYVIDYDPQALASKALSQYDTYSSLREQLYKENAGYAEIDGKPYEVMVASRNSSTFDVWNLSNEYIRCGDTYVKFSDVGTISKQKGGYTIYRHNQCYELSVAYDFLGSYQLAEKTRGEAVRYLEENVLPVGFNISSGYGGIYLNGKKSGIWIVLLVMLIIFFICSILFESLLFPLLVILLVPVSFIGVFLSFAILKCNFDQGGLASMIMLCGLVVNAGIYLLTEYSVQRRGSFIRAFNNKIIPISLTVVSTVLGLVPFLFDGKDEAFWFPFTIGTIGGMLFSLVGLVFVLPVFIKQIKL